MIDIKGTRISALARASGPAHSVLSDLRGGALHRAYPRSHKPDMLIVFHSAFDSLKVALPGLRARDAPRSFSTGGKNGKKTAEGSDARTPLLCHPSPSAPCHDHAQSPTCARGTHRAPIAADRVPALRRAERCHNACDDIPRASWPCRSPDRGYTTLTSTLSSSMADGPCDAIRQARPRTSLEHLVRIRRPFGAGGERSRVDHAATRCRAPEWCALLSAADVPVGAAAGPHPCPGATGRGSRSTRVRLRHRLGSSRAASLPLLSRHRCLLGPRAAITRSGLRRRRDMCVYRRCGSKPAAGQSVTFR